MAILLESLLGSGFPSAGHRLGDKEIPDLPGHTVSRLAANFVPVSIRQQTDASSARMKKAATQPPSSVTDLFCSETSSRPARSLAYPA